MKEGKYNSLKNLVCKHTISRFMQNLPLFIFIGHANLKGEKVTQPLLQKNLK